jgi:phage baseplate assembly protein V
MSERAVSRSADQRYFGVVVALITDNVDPEGQGRVKLTFPWFSGTMTSEWCRVAQPYAGNGYGFYWVPEVDDEVVVSFIHGDMRQPIVVGGLYNGVDKPPFSKNGQDPKVIQTRAGHRILLEDKDGQQKIEIVDASGNNSVVIDTTSNTITVSAQGDIEVSAQGQLKLSGQAGVSIESSATVKIRGATIELN